MASLAISFGSGAMTNSIADIRESDVIMMIGSNPDTGHPTIGLRIHQAISRGAKLIVVNPPPSGRQAGEEWEEREDGMSLVGRISGTSSNSS